ncbi:MAG TPA: hypothetical protein VGK64_00165, partial [Bryobacteraceae bacterium]
QLKELLREARRGRGLAHPLVFKESGEADHEMQVLYLESLLVSLTMRHPGSTDEKLAGLARERSEDTGETFDKAQSQILLHNPELYERYQQELHERYQQGKRGTTMRPSQETKSLDSSINTRKEQK